MKKEKQRVFDYSTDLKPVHDNTFYDNPLLDFVLENTNTGYWELSFPEGQERLSSTLINNLGYTREEWREERLALRSLIPEEDFIKERLILKEHLSSGGKIPYEVKLRFRHKKGHIVDIWSKGEVTEWDEYGSPLLMRGTHVDISSLSRSQRKTDEYSQRLSLLVNGINAGIWDWDMNSNRHWWSPRFYSLLHYGDKEIEAGYNNFLKLVHPRDQEVFKKTLYDHLHSSRPFKIEIRLKNKSGKYEWFEIAGSAECNEEGRYIRMAGSITNIQSRKEVEEEVRKSQFLLAETGKIAKAGAWELDFIKQKLSWSEEVFYLYELDIHKEPSLEEAMSHLPSKFKKKVSDALTRAWEAGESFDMESKFITAKKNEIWVRIAGYPVENHQKEIIAVRGIIQDINELKNKEIELQKSLDVLGYQNKRLQNFAHIVSHNLRSHTGNIKMLLNFFEKSNDEETKIEVLNNIYKVSDQLDKTIYHLNEIVEDKVDLDKDLKILNFEEVLKQNMEVLEGSIRDQNARIFYDFTKAPTVHFIHPYLDSLFLNLLSNSIKYRHKDRDPLIQLRSFSDGNTIYLEIDDNGSGIDLKRHGDKVFGMYKTFHKNSDARGIGLFLIKNQIEATGGSIEISSNPGLGTKFKISFRKQD